MSSYNVKLFEYMGSQQIRKYNRSIVKETEAPAVRFDYDIKDGVYQFKQQKIVDSKKLEKELKKKNCPNVGTESPPRPRTQEMIEHSLRTSLNRSKNKIYEIARSNEWEYFITLTFNPQKVNSKNYEYTKSIVSEWFHTMRKRYAPDLKYLVVPELHLDGKKYHFHGLISNIGRISMIDSGHQTKGGNPIYNIGTFPYGFSTATKVQDTHKAASYITKYITKELCAETMDRRRYLNSENCSRPYVREYNLSDDEFNDILNSLSENITHMKTLKTVYGGLKVDYIEVTDL